ncbi:hypothetical protein B0T10DRAFT_80256 [Thelonectria olida]|uniref:Uncharacterized protein n=1 Tax=Thelonectria olida TaxID=1576542 RepID=A0A9P9AN94_9HYPO|nr:hypothetical protein B0T10DRAFT_80256 [Thelonectria olida]
MQMAWARGAERDRRRETCMLGGWTPHLHYLPNPRSSYPISNSFHGNSCMYSFIPHPPRAPQTWWVLVTPCWRGQADRQNSGGLTSLGSQDVGSLSLFPLAPAWLSCSCATCGPAGTTGTTCGRRRKRQGGTGSHPRAALAVEERTGNWTMLMNGCNGCEGFQAGSRGSFVRCKTRLIVEHHSHHCRSHHYRPRPNTQHHQPTNRHPREANRDVLSAFPSSQPFSSL